MINVLIGVCMNILVWLCGYAITYWLFNTLKDVYENLDNDFVKDNYLQLCWIIGIILLIVYSYLVYKFHWYVNIF